MTSTQPGVVFVTGASSGFGAAVARRFAGTGARVVAAARRADRLKDLSAELGPLVLPVTLDVRDRAAVADVVSTLPAEFADVDVLVNNAGLALGLNPAPTAGRRGLNRCCRCRPRARVRLSRPWRRLAAGSPRRERTARREARTWWSGC